VIDLCGSIAHVPTTCPSGRSPWEGRVGPGKIFVSAIDQAVRIRTGQTGDGALSRREAGATQQTSFVEAVMTDPPIALDRRRECPQSNRDPPLAGANEKFGKRRWRSSSSGSCRDMARSRGERMLSARPFASTAIAQDRAGNC
jgi:hypothetical protein